MCPELLLRQPYTSKVVSPPYVHFLSFAVKLIMTLFLVPLFCNAHQRQWAGKPGGRVGRGMQSSSHRWEVTGRVVCHSSQRSANGLRG